MEFGQWSFLAAQYLFAVIKTMERLRVLVVDDEQGFIDSLTKRLVDRGFIAVGVTSGNKARMSGKRGKEARNNPT